MTPFSINGDTASLHTQAFATSNADEAVQRLLEAIEKLFGEEQGLARVRLADNDAFIPKLRAIGLVDENLTLERSQFFQSPWLWHRKKLPIITPETWTKTGDVIHPLRPDVAPGVIYQRYIPTLGKTIRFEVLDLDKHLDVFHAWQNQRRVSKFWELNKPKDELKDYLEKVYADPHHFPAIASVDDVPSGYFEIYWAAEDRIGPYYPCQPHDRAFHFLIGNPRHLGRNFFNSFVESISHFLFLEDPRTQTLLAEPRADNIALLHYLEEFPFWEKRYEFDFPHKRAALLACRRSDFFQKASFL